MPCRRSWLFRAGEKKSRSDSRFVSLISRDDARIHPSSFRGSDGAGPRESSRGVSRFYVFRFVRDIDGYAFSVTSHDSKRKRSAPSVNRRDRAPVGAETRFLAATSDGLFVVHAARSFSCASEVRFAGRAPPCAPPARARHSASSPRTARGTQDRDGSLGEGGTRGVREARSARVGSPRRLERL